MRSAAILRARSAELWHTAVSPILNCEDEAAVRFVVFSVVFSLAPLSSSRRPSAMDKAADD